MPNTFAFFIIIFWPVFTLILLRKYGVGKGGIISLLAAYMFLPASYSIDLAGLPDLDKFTITTFTILVFLKLQAKPLGISFLGSKTKWLFLAFILSPTITALSNSEAYLHMPGLSLYDGVSSSVKAFLAFYPFFIGLVYFRTESAQQKLFKYFAVSAFIYVFFVLYEIRMSPQLHNMLYGYFPHEWIQQYRSGGFRAVVFMGHGLLVAMFLALGVMFWAAVHKAKIDSGKVKAFFALILVTITLALSKSLAALMYGVFGLVMIRFFRPAKIYLVSFGLVMIFLTYPITATIGVFPHEEILQLAGSISQDRAGSLNYRFENENILLDHANNKLITGWGGWGRNRVYDPETYQDLTVTDGAWIIKIGVNGWLGFLSTYLFFVIPIWLAFRKAKTMDFDSKTSEIVFASHCLIVAILLVDQLPNASMNPLYWCLVGSLTGRCQVLLSNKVPEIQK